MTPSLQFDGPRLIRPADWPHSRRLVHTCFGGPEDSDTGNVDKRWPEETYLFAHEGVVVSQISIFVTRLRINDAYLQVGSIGGVCTLPEYRGHGLATRLMEFCTRRLVEEGASLMLISGGRGLYTRLGNVPAGRYAGFVLRAGQLRAPRPGVTLRPAVEQDAALCSLFYQAEPVHFQRPVTRFGEHFRRRLGGFHAEEWMVEMEGQPAGYLLLNVPWEYFDRPEAGVRGVFEYAGSRVALASGLAAALSDHGLSEIQVPAPWQDADLVSLLSEQAGRPDWINLPDHTARLIHFPALMNSLRPYVQARLEPALRRGLRFEQTGPLLSGGASEGGIGGASDCCAITRGRDRLELDTASMTRLVMNGPAGLHAPGALAEVVSALFPLPSFLPGLDYH